jgi:YgiT-type zinc finger domain-containing protein
MKCDFCDGETHPQRVKKQHWLRGRLYLLENVEADVCSDCGQRCFHAKTLDAIDPFLSKDHPVKESLDVEVVSL